MLTRTRLATLVSCGTILAFVGPASAQYPYSRPNPAASPFSRPAISPYLRLTQGGGSTAQNYFNLVRPQEQTIGAINNLQQQSLQNQQAFSNLSNDLASSVGTGHVTRFLGYQQYFLNPNAHVGTGGAIGGGAGAFGSTRFGTGTAGTTFGAGGASASYGASRGSSRSSAGIRR